MWSYRCNCKVVSISIYRELLFDATMIDSACDENGPRFAVDASGRAQSCGPKTRIACCFGVPQHHLVIAEARPCCAASWLVQSFAHHPLEKPGRKGSFTWLGTTPVSPTLPPASSDQCHRRHSGVIHIHNLFLRRGDHMVRGISRQQFFEIGQTAVVVQSVDRLSSFNIQSRACTAADSG